jgi:sugar phosphate isomerase/epimerase
MQQHASRRDFLRLVSAAASAAPLASLAADSDSGALVGSQLYGWGQYYERSGKDLWANLGEAFSALRDAGYDYAEGSVDASNPEKNAEFAAKLREKGLRPVSLYTGGGFHDDGAERTVEGLVKAAAVCAKAGFQVIVCNPNPIGRDKTSQELATQGKALALFGRELKKLGLRLGLHHHTPELNNNAREYHYNFAVTSSGEVDFCIDTHWMYRGGVVPMDALRQYGGRVVSWHLRQSRDKIWWEDLDTGDIDYAEIAAFAKERNLPRRFSVELALENGTKITRNVVDNHRRSRDFVKRVFGV